MEKIDLDIIDQCHEYNADHSDQFFFKRLMNDVSIILKYGLHEENLKDGTEVRRIFSSEMEYFVRCIAETVRVLFENPTILIKPYVLLINLQNLAERLADIKNNKDYLYDFKKGCDFSEKILCSIAFSMNHMLKSGNVDEVYRYLISSMDLRTLYSQLDKSPFIKQDDENFSISCFKGLVRRITAKNCDHSEIDTIKKICDRLKLNYLAQVNLTPSFFRPDDFSDQVHNLVSDARAQTMDRVAKLFFEGDDSAGMHLGIDLKRRYDEMDLAVIYFQARLRDKMFEVLRDPNLLKYDLATNQVIFKEMEAQYPSGLGLWTLPETSAHSANLNEILQEEGNILTLSDSGAKAFIVGLSNSEKVIFNKMQNRKLVPILDMPYYDYYATEEDANNNDNSKIKPGLFTLADEIFRTCGFSAISISSKNNGCLEKYLRQEDHERINEQYRTEGKVRAKVRWSIQEDLTTGGYTTGYSPENIIKRVNRASEDCVYTTYLTDIALRLWNARNNSWRSCKAVMTGIKLDGRRVGLTLCNDNNRNRGVVLSYQNGSSGGNNAVVNKQIISSESKGL